MMRTARLIFSFWGTAYGRGTWRRFGYGLLTVPLALASLALAAAGRGRAAAAWQQRLARRLAGQPASAPPPGHPGPRVAGVALAGLATGLACWLLLQYLAVLMVANVAYPARAYIRFTAPGAGNILPWNTWLDVHLVHGPSPWVNDHYTAWGGPTLAGAWLVHAGLALLLVFPVLAWAIRGVTRLQARLTSVLLHGGAGAAGGRVLASRDA